MRLSDACEINPRSQAVSDDTLVSFVAMPDVSEDGKINTSIVRPYGEVKKGYTVFQEGDILFAKITPCMENGKGALAVGLQNGIGVGSTEFHVLRPNTDLLDGMWLYYLTAWPAFRHEAEIHMTGSAGQKRVPKTFLERYQLAIPTLDEQKDQVSQLDRIRRIIDSRQRQLRTLDTLIKARFVEMFGDMADPDCTWPTCRLIETCDESDDIKCGPFGTQLSKDEYQESGIPVWEIPQINSAFAIAPEHFLTIEKATQLRAYSLSVGDIVMSRKGNVGKCAIFPADKPDGILHSDVLRIRVSSKKTNPCFMMCQLHFSRDIIRQIEMVSSGAIMAGVNVTKLKDIIVKMPPLELQNQFATFVSQVDKSKVVVQAALEKAQTLFDSLMQQYFG